MKPVKVGLLGIGTVGSGTFAYSNAIARRSRAARPSESKSPWSRRATSSARGRSSGRHHRGRRCARRRHEPHIDIVVEVIGGTTIARSHPRSNRTRQTRRHANKALLALHGNEIFKAAREHT